jgi:hypothetical protein
MRVPADVIVAGTEDSFVTKMPSGRFSEDAASETSTARGSVQQLVHPFESVGIVEHRRRRQMRRAHKFCEFTLSQHPGLEALKGVRRRRVV